MIHFLEVAGIGLLVAVIGTVMLLKKNDDGKVQETSDGGNVVELYPHPDDPEYYQDRDNTPTWKIKKAQTN